MSRLPLGSYLLLALVVAVVAEPVLAFHDDHHCIHDEVQAQVPILKDDRELDLKKEYIESFDSGKRSVQAVPVWEDLRILVYTGNIDTDAKQCGSAGQSVTLSSGAYTCTGDDVLTSTKRTYLIEQMLASAASRLASLRVVRQNNGTLQTLSGTSTCNGGSSFTILHSLAVS
jgi:hypothetical protein